MYRNRFHLGECRPGRLAAAIATAVVCGFAACTDTPDPVAPQAVAPPASLAKGKPGTESGGRIVFASDRDAPGNWDIYSMNPDGSDVIRITADASGEWAPSVSADGGRIAFISNRDGTESIYVMDASGGNVSRVTPVGMTGVFDPVISRSGTAVAFTRVLPDAGAEIFTINVNGSGLTRLTDNAVPDGNPSWGPKDQKIVFRRTLDTNDEIYSLNRDGTGEVRLTDNSASDGKPSWSPDGRQITFASNRDGMLAVYAMSPDGRKVTRLTAPSQYTQDAPAWSPSGTQIAFVSNTRIAIVNADGTGFTVLTDFFSVGPAWGR